MYSTHLLLRVGKRNSEKKKTKLQWVRLYMCSLLYQFLFKQCNNLNDYNRGCNFLTDLGIKWHNAIIAIPCDATFVLPHFLTSKLQLGIFSFNVNIMTEKSQTTTFAVLWQEALFFNHVQGVGIFIVFWLDLEFDLDLLS